MRVRTLQSLSTPRGEIPAGKILSIPEHLMEKLKGKVEAIADTPGPRVWLTANGELRSSGLISDLAKAIVEITADDLPLQRELLARHCESYDRHHINDLWEAWEEDSAILEYDQGMSRTEAELAAAKRYHLGAFTCEFEGRRNMTPYSPCLSPRHIRIPSRRRSALIGAFSKLR